ncbi:MULTISPECIES: Xaa-Pro peptidase family protein [unclassified Streptococcus]|uniref:M24 family metallopeptidase n=1 Tax=unclassified Streptococcus TaxID=2608887 RepID=UPI001072B20D|nr:MULTISPECIES: Xaa-Pro peptidase family protein [unclassified Streptococcus]MBF0786784.1 aminopeptidase P family protein [Streptococcus sp. 19428wC2_LYSM12]MCQ9211023.1 Xaa-Pro peptidase family protein [Streptococcus sp. B01]MCQ9214298.1 Xaa-Pro peptidase family protein [Streptococcus sp. O1]TFV06326.1 aminopeptidase P family protein [Streptococcus sp. LYSM12]
MTKIIDILSHLQSTDLDMAVLSDPVSINYLTGFYNDPHERQMFLFISQTSAPLLFVPALDAERARKSLDFSVVGYIDSENPWEKIKASLPEKNYKRIGLEFDQLILTKYQGLKTVFEHATFDNLTPIINRMRLIKSADEMQKMMIAGKWADKAIQIGFEAISLDKTETDIIAEIEFAMKREGLEMSFETMVLAGHNAANPHGIPGPHKVENNALLLFDLGVMANGYASDMTRTVAVGQPDQFKKDIYALTLEAQQAALEMIKPGVTAHEVDWAARQVIEKAGYGEYFNHRLGHGIGMDVHEFPSIMAGNDLILEKGMCFSVEPGIYIPGKVGVRIEDCGYVTENGFEVFTNTGKDLFYFE